MQNNKNIQKDIIEINGVKYKKLMVYEMIINGSNKNFISSEDTKSNYVNMKIIIK